jgi:hypothetical protein
VVNGAKLRGVFLRDGAHRRNLKVREGGGEEGTCSASETDLVGEVLEQLIGDVGIVVGMRRIGLDEIRCHPNGVRWGDCFLDVKGTAVVKFMKDGCSVFPRVFPGGDESAESAFPFREVEDDGSHAVMRGWGGVVVCGETAESM